MNTSSEYRSSPHHHTLELKYPHSKTKVLIKYKKTARTISRNFHNAEINNSISNHSSMNFNSTAKD